MKISELWLREWVDVPATTKEIAERLVMAGLELEIEPAVAEQPDHVVVGRIEKIGPHPQADKLRVCEVDVGRERLQIVCGAANARAGMVAPTARVGAKLPGGIEIKAARLRGVDSAGMLCSAKELGLADKSEGLLELDETAAPGTPLAEYLHLKDRVLALEITPNRGDCLSVQGLAREIAALYDRPLKKPAVAPAAVAATESVKVEIEKLEDCPNYAGRVVAGIDPQARTPDWMREKLRRSGVRCIHPVVDVTNYAMLELGQPMHAFDLANLAGAVRVRRAAKGEKLTLLNQQLVELNAGELLIADDRGPLALAGVMGGANSEVSERTTAVFLESACFAPAAVAGTGRRHKLHSDAIYRFERGVDPAIQREGLERATQLILDICGGKAGPVTHAGRAQPPAATVNLRHERLNALLGHAIGADEVERLLPRLGIGVQRAGQGAWTATVPSHRYDISIEPDLIEEVARLYGYDRIPAKPYAAELVPATQREGERSAARVKDFLAARGYQEAVTYSFVEPKLQERLAPGAPSIRLDNPIADTMSAMRTTLWAGLIPAWLYNAQRQQRRVRLFELGACYEDRPGGIVETMRLGGLVAGEALPEQWGGAARPADFFDVKGDLEALVGAKLSCRKAEHPALHPGRSAEVRIGDSAVGWLGALHPSLVRALDLPAAPLLCELDWAAVRAAGVPRAQPVSEFPSSRRDLALVLREEVEAGAVLAVARRAAGAHLREVRLFDVYRGAGLPNGCKSIALGLIFQDYSRTLTDEEVDASVQSVASRLTDELGASIRI
ncbi:MAG: phenylalanine--tRNA ligase subunit beta [Gammaproteobacteria bacterium]|nr:phenylalanine--tRNA ligase subunit beta [Gammaproteobacteria bacterium]